MLEIHILGSGSSGNSCLVRSERTCVLVDAGLSARRLCERLAGCGVGPEQLDAILLTHEHGDHAAALKVLCKKYPIPVFANPMTAEAVRFQLGLETQWKLFPTGGIFPIGDLTVQSFSVPHDAADPVGFVISNEVCRFAVLTDLGMVTKSVVHFLREVDAILIEANYDEHLLEMDTKRPWSVKQRISSRHGHLSNSAAADLLRQAASKRLQKVILGHLSRDCNSPECATGHVLQCLLEMQRPDVEVHCAIQDVPGPFLRLLPPVQTGTVAMM